MMTVSTFQRNRAFLDERKAAYQFSCRTNVSSPRPNDVQAALPGIDFICAPLMKEREWRFMTAHDMRVFKQKYTTLDNKS